MKKSTMILSLFLSMIITSLEAFASSVVDFEGGISSPLILAEKDGFAVLSIFGDGADAVFEEGGNSYAHAGIGVVVERDDSAPFQLLGFDGRAETGVVSLRFFDGSLTRVIDFSVGTELFQPAVNLKFDPMESVYWIEFIGVVDVDNVKLGVKTEIPKPSNAVPLPGALWLFGVGLFGVFSVAAQKKGR